MLKFSGWNRVPSHSAESRAVRFGGWSIWVYGVVISSTWPCHWNVAGFFIACARGRPADFLGLDVSNIGQTCLSTAAHHPSGRIAEAQLPATQQILASGKDPKMSDPSSLVFELCSTIDRFYERKPDLSVSDVLAALDEVSMALAFKRARTHWSRANVVRMSDYRHSI